MKGTECTFAEKSKCSAGPLNEGSGVGPLNEDSASPRKAEERRRGSPQRGQCSAGPLNEDSTEVAAPTSGRRWEPPRGGVESSFWTAVLAAPRLHRWLLFGTPLLVESRSVEELWDLPRWADRLSTLA